MSAALVQQVATDPTVLPKTERLVSLDVFRGITIAGMILVNNPGSWSYVYPPLEHAKWDGWTPTDLIFPFFLFIVGIAITLSLGGRIERGASRARMIPRILRRAVTLFALGLCLSGFPFYHFSTIRIPGVLQRIAVCYLFASIIFLFTSIRAQAAIATVLIAAYWMIMKLVPVPASYVEQVIAKSADPNVTDPSLYIAQNANIAAYVDNTLLHGHLWSQTKTWDPEGLLSTIPAIATALLGVLVGHWLKSSRSAKEKITGLILGGATGIVAGEIMNVWFPINKNLWTSSYAVFTAGMAMLFLALCYWLVDFKGYKRVAMPFVIYGMNAITVFVLSGVVARAMGLIKETTTLPDGTRTSISLWNYYYENLFTSWAGPMNGSLAFAIAFILLMFLPVWFLYRHRIFIKV
ncbi:MAG TPA: heparan-alpha-glucosaminide N-acetyltransferase domain-containing protein [Blastocatellia bacterium]|nr:heparan-alpha-glucosaminide N-acetyltransferase domain-containing protein [Blastocatellia bacterium]